MKREKAGLGRGLEALIPTSSAHAGTEIPIDAIVPNPWQPRRGADHEALENLAGSIRQHGVLQPLVVTETGDGQYQLIAGERRWLAAQMAGLERVPAVVREATPQDLLELALVENIQRADLNPLEEAAAYRRLVDEFGLTQEAVAQRVGKGRVSIANSLRLLGLPPEAKEALAAGQITEGHARALLRVPALVDQLGLLRAVVEDGLSVRQTEEMARRLTEGVEQRRAPRPPKPPETAALENELRVALGTKVELFQTRKGGKVVIHFFSSEELQGIYERLVPRG